MVGKGILSRDCLIPETDIHRVTQQPIEISALKEKGNFSRMNPRGGKMATPGVRFPEKAPETEI